MIEDKIKEIYDFLKSEILKGNYTVQNLEEYTVEILIDGKYKTCLWIANIPKFNLRIYDYEYLSLCIGADRYKEFASNEERLSVFEQLQPKIKDFRKSEDHSRKIKEYNRLKIELGL